MSKKTFLKMSTQEFLRDSKDVKFDTRLVEKRIGHGFLKEEEIKAHVKSLDEETEYDFTSAEALDNEEPEEAPKKVPSAEASPVETPPAE